MCRLPVTRCPCGACHLPARTLPPSSSCAAVAIVMEETAWPVLQLLWRRCPGQGGGAQGRAWRGSGCLLNCGPCHQPLCVCETHLSCGPGCPYHFLSWPWTRSWLERRWRLAQAEAGVGCGHTAGCCGSQRAIVRAQWAQPGTGRAWPHTTPGGRGGGSFRVRLRW